MRKFDHNKIASGVQLLLEGLGEDISREGLAATPNRFARFCDEIFYGYTEEPPVITLFESDKESGMIELKDIPFISFCEHHLVPFYGTIDISYIPSKQGIAGFGSLTKVCDYYSARLQIQERLTSRIGQYVFRLLEPRQLKVTITAEHFCMKLHGSKKQTGTVTTTFEK